jgi:hypothetical protein
MPVKKMLLSIAGLIFIAIAAVICHAQYEIQPEAPRARIYRVRIVNEMGRSICVKLVGYGQNRLFHADLSRGENVVQDLYSGVRALCVWDDNNGRLIILGTVNIARSGKLRILPIVFAPKSAEGERAAEPATGQPSFEVEEE